MEATACTQSRTMSHIVSRSLTLHLAVSDPEVVGELERIEDEEDRDRYALTALRVGVLALSQAQVGIDANRIRNEADHLLESLSAALRTHAGELQMNMAKTLGAYFDPDSGQLSNRLERLVRDGGELEAVLVRHLNGEASTIACTLDERVGEHSPLLRLLSPDQRGGLVATLSDSVQSLLAEQRRHILDEFSLDQPTSALSRFVTEIATANGELRQELASDLDRVHSEFSLDNEHGALSRLVHRVERVQGDIAAQFSRDHEGSALNTLTRLLQGTQEEIRKRLTLDDDSAPLAVLQRQLMSIVTTLQRDNQRFHAGVREALASLTAQREESRRSTRHGTAFEEQLGELLADQARRLGDIYEHVGNRVGLIPQSKVGDHLLIMGPDTPAAGAHIVVESKARKATTLAAALAEMATARKNRGADIGIFVFSARHKPVEVEGLCRYGNDIVIAWDEDDPASDVMVQAAVSVARALVFRDATRQQRPDIDTSTIERAINSISKDAAALDQIATWATTIEKNGRQISERCGVLKQRISSKAEVLDEQLRHLIALLEKAS